MALNIDEFNVVPLSSGFMITSIVGLIISGIYVYPKSQSWGFTFVLFFVLMLIASLISMTKSPVDEHLKVHERRRKK